MDDSDPVPVSSGSSQLSSTVTFTLRTYSFMFSLYSCAASAFAGEFGFGSCRRLCILVRIAATSYVGDQRFWRMSKHSSPLAYTLGWNMRERNLTVGGLLGYDSSKVNRSLNVPSSKGVSPGNEQWHKVSHHARARTAEDEPGPKITAFHSMMLSGSGLPEIPPGGSDESLLKSRMRRFLQFVD